MNNPFNPEDTNFLSGLDVAFRQCEQLDEAIDSLLAVHLHEMRHQDPCDYLTGQFYGLLPPADSVTTLRAPDGEDIGAILCEAKDELGHFKAHATIGESAVMLSRLEIGEQDLSIVALNNRQLSSKIILDGPAWVAEELAAALATAQIIIPE